MRCACCNRKCTCFEALLETPGDLDSVSSGSMSPDLGDEWKRGDPRSRMWESEEGPWAESESASTIRSRVHNVGNEALRLIGTLGSGERIALFLCCVKSYMICSGCSEQSFLSRAATEKDRVVARDIKAEGM